MNDSQEQPQDREDTRMSFAKNDRTEDEVDVFEEGETGLDEIVGDSGQNDDTTDTETVDGTEIEMYESTITPITALRNVAAILLAVATMAGGIYLAVTQDIIMGIVMVVGGYVMWRMARRVAIYDIFSNARPSSGDGKGGGKLTQSVLDAMEKNPVGINLHVESKEKATNR